MAARVSRATTASFLGHCGSAIRLATALKDHCGRDGFNSVLHSSLCGPTCTCARSVALYQLQLQKLKQLLVHDGSSRVALLQLVATTSPVCPYRPYIGLRPWGESPPIGNSMLDLYLAASCCAREECSRFQCDTLASWCANACHGLVVWCSCGRAGVALGRADAILQSQPSFFHLRRAAGCCSSLLKGKSRKGDCVGCLAVRTGVLAQVEDRFW